MRLSKLSDAEESAKKAVDRDPQATSPLIRLSEIYQLQGRRADAITVVERAGKLDPTDDGVSQRLASLRKSAGEDPGLRVPAGMSEGNGLQTLPKTSRPGSDVGPSP